MSDWTEDPGGSALASAVADAGAGDGTVVAIAGAGSIGVAFAIRFAAVGWGVRLWDPYPDALERARVELRQRLDLIARYGLMSDGAEAVAERVEFADDLAKACDAAALFQECAPEKVELKGQLFAAAATHLPQDAILASSSSAIAPGELAAELPESLAVRLLVAHPGNPPYLLPIIELVPSAGTSERVLADARRLYVRARMRPVVVRHEPEGFIYNRLQGALLREAYCLLRDGVATVDEIDEVVRSGLGRRWSLIGPFETADLNTRGGLLSHAEKMGPAYERMGAERGQHDPWSQDLVVRAEAERRQVLPMEQWSERVAWRDEQLLRLTPVWEKARDEATAAGS